MSGSSGGVDTRTRSRWKIAGRLSILLLVVAMMGISPAAQAQPPAGDIKNFDFIRTVPGTASITSLNVLFHEQGDVLVAVGRFGVRTFDLSDPENPTPLDHLTSDELRLEGDTAGTFWQSESTNVDHRRSLIFLSRDPRAYNKPQNTGTSGVYIIDASNPSNLELIIYHPIPAGHPSTCIEECRFLWTGGPAPAVGQPADWVGRPIFVTDIRDARRPYTFPEPIDLGRRNGVTDYSHDVEVDNAGIAWVSGRGGVRGYRTSGTHWDPVREEVRTATAWDPIPYAGGGGPASWNNTSGAIHNSERPIDAAHRPGNRGQRDNDRSERPFAKDGSNLAAHGFAPGELVFATHEDFQSTCAATGKLYIASLRGSFNGESWKSTTANPFSLDIVSTWHPWQQEGTNPSTSSCSGHYFRMKDGIVYMSWYGQGLRAIDVRDPYNPTQVAYFRPNGTSSYTPMLYKDLVYNADNGRGVIDILRVNKAAFNVVASGQSVVAPAISAAAIDAAMEGLAPDALLGWMCPIPVEAVE